MCLHRNCILFISLYFWIVTEITSILKIKNAENISNISEKVRCFLVTYISLLKNKTHIAVPEANFYINMISVVCFKISKKQRDRTGTVTQSLKYLRWSRAYITIKEQRIWSVHGKLRMEISHETSCKIWMTFKVIYHVPQHPNFSIWEPIHSPFLEIFVQLHQLEFFLCGISASEIVRHR